MLYPRDLGVTVEPDDLAVIGGGIDFGPDASIGDLKVFKPDMTITDHPDQG